MNKGSRCWCGNDKLVSFSPAYLTCTACNTLVTAVMPGLEISRVTDDEQDFYGRNYWFSHQEKDLGFDNIEARSRHELTERCLYWLRTLLKYKLPPAQVLELGCSHGGFVALMSQCGFSATGLELSPWVVDFAHKTFHIPMLLGPVETHPIPPGSLDVIALMDVLEHLPDPVSTMRHCLGLLKPDGIFLIQTPRYPDGESHAQMVSAASSFLEVLKADEHLFLFSEQSIRRFFHQLGVDHIEFEPAIFGHYDMFMVVGRTPAATFSREEIEQVLGSTVGGRVLQALLDNLEHTEELTHRLHLAVENRATTLVKLNDLTQRLQHNAVDRSDQVANIRDLIERVRYLEADRSTRLKSIKRLNVELMSAQADRAARLERIKELAQRIEIIDADRAARLVQIHEFTKLIQDQDASRTARLDQIRRLTDQLQGAQADRSALIDKQHDLNNRLVASEAICAVKLMRIQEMTQRLHDLETERATRLESINALNIKLDEAKADRAARLETIRRLSTQLEGAQADRAARLETIRRLSTQLEGAQADRAARLEVMQRLTAQIKKLEGQRDASLTG